MLRWKALARRAGVRLRPLVRVGGYPLFYLETPALGHEGGLYLSAGIHGDEPAGSEGLVAWAEANVAQLRHLPLLIFPCLNPWGLTQNMRCDEQGHDLNRSFHRPFPLITAMKRVVGQRRFAASVHLHEDFDGEGLYLYELSRRDSWGDALLTAARPILSIDPRRRIDRWTAKSGLIRATVRRERYERVGHPEALWLFFNHTDHTFTIETPSEIDIERRVAAQVAVLAEVARKVFPAS